MLNATRACELLVGLPAVNVLEVAEPLSLDRRVVITVESIMETPCCPNCGERAWVKDRPVVELVDLTCFGRPVTLRWRKHRWWCPRSWCGQGSWTHEDPRIAAPRLSVTDRAGRWATRQVGERGRAVSDVAGELGADWHAINDAVMAYGEALLDADGDRVGTVEALGVDGVLFARLGRWRTQAWSTSIVDVSSGQLLDVIPGRSSGGLCEWLAAMPQTWREGIRWAVLDLSGPWWLAFDTMLPWADQVADPFHLVKLANQRLDEVRRRVQNETLGHRGRKDDPLYRSRRLLTKADERLDHRGRTKLLGLLDAGDPRGEVRTAWHAKETVRGIYDIADPDLAEEFVVRLGHDLQDDDCPPDPRSASSAAPSPAGPPRSRRGTSPECRTGPPKAQQPDQEGEAGGLRVPTLRALPDPSPALRRQAQLGPTRHRHTPLKREAPENWADARVLLDKAIAGCLADEVPEIVALGRTLRSWRREILAHHTTGASNGPTEGLNLCVKVDRG